MKDFELIHKIPILKNKSIIKVEILSDSFGAFCKKITFNDNEKIIVKELEKNNLNYNSIFFEGKSMEYLSNIFPEFFPSILYLDQKILIMTYIENNKVKNKNYNLELAKIVSKIHSVKNNSFGFNYNTPIGGLEQPNEFQDSWIEFYTNKRLGMIFEIINNTKPMPDQINKNLEKLLKNLKDYIPNNPEPSLIHGDLWDGNILFNDNKIVGLIDPGIYFAHNELELAYLSWFNYVDEEFFQIYNEFIKVDKNFFEYQEIYQLYWSLLNVHLWSRDYIQDVNKLLSKFN